MSEEDRPNLTGGLVVSTMVTLSLMYGSLYFAPFSFLVPTPLYYGMAVHGLPAGLKVAALCILLFIPFGGAVGAFFIGLCTLVAALLAHAFERQTPLPIAFMRATLAGFGFAGVALFAATIHIGVNIFDMFALWGEQFVAITLQAYQTSGSSPELIALIEENRMLYQTTFASLVPSFIFCAIAALCLITLLLVRVCSLKFLWGIHFTSQRFEYFRAPEPLVWALVLGGFSALLTDGIVATMGLNLMLLSAVLYLAQGVAIAHHFLSTKNISPFLRALFYFFIFSQPLFMLITSLFGLVDLWVDFRRLDSSNQTSDGTH